jgi:tetratricopeptide (TPR) repeat protein
MTEIAAISPDVLPAARQSVPALSGDAIVAAAEAAAATGDLDAAARQWAILRDAYPNSLAGYYEGATVLLRAGRVEEAERVTEIGLRRFPDAPDLLHVQALTTLDRGDAAEAARRWGSLRERFPDRTEGYRFAILALRQADQVDEADELALLGLARFEAEPGIWAEYVLTAVHRNDWTEAAVRAERLRETFPDAPEGYRFGIMALREAGEVEAAEQLGCVAVEGFPEQPDLWLEHALTALQAADWTGAAERLAVVRAAFPDAPDGFRQGILALREAGRVAEAEELGAAGVARFSASPEMLHQHALTALHRGDTAEMMRRWAAMRAAFPDAPEGYCFGIHALREAGRLEEAEQLGDAAVVRLADNPAVWREHALTAMYSGDSGKAARRWEKLRALDPGAADAYRFGTLALRALGQHEAAARLAEAGVQRFPDEPDIWNEYATSSLELGDTAEATRRFDRMRERFPDHRGGYIGGVAARRQSTLFDEAMALARAADYVAETGLLRFSDEPALWQEHALVAMRRGDWQAAVNRWDQMRARFPDAVDGYRHAIVALREAGRMDAAETLGEAAVARFPADPETLNEHAWTALHDGRADEAALRWELMRTRFPDHRDGYGRGIMALRDAQRFDEAEALEIAAMVRFPDNKAMHLFLRFESLGDNCEFGVVQRHFGAEPIGLLRWGGIRPQDLVRALDNDFAAFGDPDTTELHLTDEGEYMIVGEKAGFHMHSFVKSTDTDRDAFHARTVRRLVFLRDKLLRDLRNAEKICVYKPRTGAISDEDIAAIHAALRRHGPNTLLCVVNADEQYPDGTLENRADGLLVGRIAGVSPTAHFGDILFDSWLRICRAAADMVWKSDGA